jgi:hypothetical protein
MMASKSLYINFYFTPYLVERLKQAIELDLLEVYQPSIESVYVKGVYALVPSLNFYLN